MSTATSVVPRQSVWQFILSELKPKGPIFTPFNVISVPTILAGLAIVVWRFAFGLGSMGGYGLAIKLFGQPPGQVTGKTFCQATRINEYQRGAMIKDVRHQLFIKLFPNLVGQYWCQW